MEITSTTSATRIRGCSRRSAGRWTSSPSHPGATRVLRPSSWPRSWWKLHPGGLSKVLFAPSGSDAIEMALAYARAATGRFKTISFWDSYHGAGFGARSVGGEAMFHGGPIGPLLCGTEHVPPFGDYRNAWGVTEGSAELCARMIRYVLEKEGDVAAVIAEPVRAVPYVPPAGFWQSVRQACDEFGALLIFDEIPTGLGKTGTMFACQHDDVVPDILVLGKSLGGGILPIACMICRPELDVCGSFAFGHYTHEKNPVTTRAGLTTLQIIQDEQLVANAARVGAIGLQRLKEMMDRHPLIGDVRGRGCLLGAELVIDRQKRTPAPRRGRRRALQGSCPRFELQDHDGQCSDPDAAADHHRGADASGPGDPRGVDRRGRKGDWG